VFCVCAIIYIGSRDPAGQSAPQTVSFYLFIIIYICTCYFIIGVMLNYWVKGAIFLFILCYYYWYILFCWAKRAVIFTIILNHFLPFQLSYRFYYSYLFYDCPIIKNTHTHVYTHIHTSTLWSCSATPSTLSHYTRVTYTHLHRSVGVCARATKSSLVTGRAYLLLY